MSNPIYAVNCKKYGMVLFNLTSMDDDDPNGPMGIVEDIEHHQEDEKNLVCC